MFFKLEDTIDFELKRTNRKTVSIEVKPDGSVIVRGPLSLSERKARQYVEEKRDWIISAKKKIQGRKDAYDTGSDESKASLEPFDPAFIKQLKKQARKELVPLVEEMAGIMKADYNKVFIKMQTSVWGSCSSKKNINLNCLLVLLPTNVQRYVVVHELSHLEQMNHSKAFWARVAKYQPTYYNDRKQLKSQGAVLIARARLSK